MPPHDAGAARDLENIPNDVYYEKLAGKEESENPKFLVSGKKAADVAAGGMPFYVMPVLVTAITLGSIGGPIMKKMEMDGAAPMAVGAWRHQVSATVMFPFALMQWCWMSREERSAALTWSNLGTICLCALGLTCHFGFWIWSLDNTALTHSLLLCIMSPLFITLFTFLQHGTVLCGELVGVALGIAGSMILAAGAKVEKDIEYTVVGDLAALTASCGFGVYLMCGKSLRGKLPLFVYMWPVNVVVLIYLSILLSVFYEADVLTMYDDSGLFSWITRGYVLPTLVMGLGPGFVCHVSYNSCMRYVKPLIVSVGFSVSPLVGSLIGWAMGETGVPGMLTVFGGLVTMGATVWVSHASSVQAKSQSEDKLEEEKLPLNAKNNYEP